MVCERLELNKNCVHIYHISQAEISTTMFSEPLTPPPPLKLPSAMPICYIWCRYNFNTPIIKSDINFVFAKPTVRSMF